MAIPILGCVVCCCALHVVVFEQQCGFKEGREVAAAVAMIVLWLVIIGVFAVLPMVGMPNGGPGTGDFDDDAVVDDAVDEDDQAAVDDKSITQFIVLGVSAFVLFVVQGMARSHRGDTLPLLIEVIAFFSVLE